MEQGSCGELVETRVRLPDGGSFVLVLPAGSDDPVVAEYRGMLGDDPGAQEILLRLAEDEAPDVRQAVDRFRWVRGGGAAPPPWLARARAAAGSLRRRLPW
jgi:hypothetical protein